MKFAVLAAVSSLSLAASTLAMPATNSTLEPEVSLDQWKDPFGLIWRCHCRHKGRQDYKKNVKKDMQCLMDHTAKIRENIVPGNEPDADAVAAEETKRCEDDAVRRYSRTDCQPEKLEHECYFPIWVEYSKCVGNSPSTSKAGSDCPKDPSFKPEATKPEEAQPKEDDEDSCEADPEEVKPEARPEEAQPEEDAEGACEA